VIVDVAYNDTDSDGDVLVISAYVDGSSGIVAITDGGTVGNNDGRLTYTHTGGCSSSDAFTYAVSDGKGGFSGSTVVNVAITGVTPCDTTPPEIIGISVLPASGTNSAFGDNIAITVTAADSQSLVWSAGVSYKRPDGLITGWSCYIGQPSGSCTMAANITFGSSPFELTGLYEFASAIVEDEHNNAVYMGEDGGPPDIIIREDQTVGFVY
jgi:hypothetical protein